MDGSTWQEEWNSAWAEHQRVREAWDGAMPSTRSSLPVQFESIDTAKLDQLKSEMDEAWRRILDLDGSRP